MGLFSELKGRQVQPSREQQYHLLPDYQYPTPRGRQWHQFDCQERKKNSFVVHIGSISHLQVCIETACESRVLWKSVE